ncbi:major capsid protein [Paenibacillus radicis (ex Xue et al. 2023)]|uniref:Major capsid protein n=1 Tax=Paenibacillus radicis (ex Xue et al. 2023) TaxID=2972489 RepID=A0ABT1YJY3_9BACL|nr:major capsid protein [Paenibacillus radicis (ex Xue et al. 2023)]MCR8633486.1 major capsid protein [Paenibacillus radicis (ex Xue et al. 2023)]
MANLLDPYYLTEVVENIRTDTKSFRGAQLLTGGADIKPALGMTIEYDVTYDDTGMTPPTGLNDPSPIHAAPIVKHMSFTNQEWREKSIIDREKIDLLRAPGTDLEKRWGEQYINDMMVNLDQRLQTRTEWMRWKPLSGTLTVPATATKPAVTIDYGVPAANKPTAATLWSDTANADPLADIDGWKLKFRGSGARARKIIVNQKVDNMLKANAKIRDLLKTTYGRDVLSADSLAFVMKAQLDGLEYEVYDAGYIDDSGTFYPFIPDNVCIIVGEGMTGTMMDLITSPNNYENIFKGHVGKFALAKLIVGDPDQWQIINGITVLPKMKYVNWHIYATVA